MRVLMVSSLWPPEVLGGAEQYAQALSDRLRDDGHVVGVVTLGVAAPDVVAMVPAWPYPMREFAAQPPARRALFHAADLARPATARVLDAAIEEFAPDVVHSHVVQGMSAVAMSRPGRRGLGHVHTIHDYWLLCQRNSMVQRDGTPCVSRCGSCRAISRWREQQLRRFPPDIVLAVSEAVARPHLEALAWTRDRMRVLYNPVAPPPAADRSPRPPGTPPTFGFLGRLTTDKGIITLLHAFSRAAIPGARLIVAGDGPQAGAVAAATGTGSVELRGWVDAAAKEQFFSEIDVLVVPSQWPDPAPLVVNEARGRAVPVIGSTAGGIPELVDPLDTPLLVAPGDASALAAALARFAGEPDRPPRGGDAATAPPGWDEHVDGVVAAYREARARHGGSDPDRGSRG